MKIEDEIQQYHFPSTWHKAHLNLLFTAAWLNQHSTQVLRPYNISWQQFNILRILRGMHPRTASIKLLTERMIDKMSNASRLVEKLKQKGYVERQPCPADRRKVEVGITALGLEILEQASSDMERELERLMDHLNSAEAEDLNILLDKVRGS